MKKIFSFAKKKKHPSSTPDSGSVLSVGYELKDKDLGKVHKAASAGDLAKLKQLAKKNDINQLDKENRTALHIACASGHVEVVQFLVESKAKLNLCDNQNRSALMKAVQGQHERCVSILLENHADPNLVDINGNTALHLTANIPSISTAVLLLEHEADINTQNKEGFTPLTVSVREDHIEMAEFLLKEGADVNLLGQDHRSPLMIAAGNGQIGMLRLLLQFNADITLKDTKGWSADDYAVMNGHHPCSLLIIEHGTQRNNGSSLSHQGLRKTMKTTLLGSPSKDVEGGLSVGGPALDKDDFKDTSQSESLSRVSKSGADEWPSTDDDESVLIEKKVQKVNLRKMIASKKGEASLQPDRSLSSSESLPESENRAQRTPSLLKALPSSKDSTAEKGNSKHVEQPLSSQGSHEQHAKEEDEVGEEEEEEDDDDEDDEGEDEDKEDTSDDDEDDEDEEEEEESEESDGEEEEEENECEKQNDNCVVSVNDCTTDFESLHKPSFAGDPKMNDSDSQHVPGTNIPLSIDSSSSNVDASEKDARAQAQSADLVCLVETASYYIPATLNVEHDCVVSAIRVESKFSDEDDSLGKDCMRPSGQNITSNLVSTVGSVALKHCTDILSAIMVQEKEDGNDEDGDDSWSNKQNSGETVWNDSDDEEDNQIGRFRRNTALAKQRNILHQVDAEKNDSDSQKDAFKDEKHRSSWGSSIEDSDTDLPEEDNEGTPNQTNGALPQPSENRPDPSSEPSLVTAFTECVSAEKMIDGPKPSSPHCLPSIHPSRNRTDESASDNSQWDSSENIGQNDSKKVGSPVSIANVERRQTNEQQCPDGSWEEENKYTERESNDPSPAVSSILENNPILDADDSVGQLSEIGENLDSENVKGDDNSWDDEDEIDDDVKLKTINDKVADCDDDLERQLSTPTNMQSQKLRPKRLQEEAGVNATDEENAQPCIEGSNESPGSDKRKLVCHSAAKNSETNNDSDSKDQTSQYGFVSDKVPDVGNDSDNTLNEPEAKSTEYIPQQTSAFAKVLDEESYHKKISSSPLTKDDQNSEGTIFFDELLPQTEIDDVDLDSPDEAESIDMTSQEHRDVEGQVIQKEDSTDNEDSDDEEEDEERDLSNKNDLPEESGHSLDTASPVHETEAFRDKKRDFLSELGLEKEDEEQDSWDSEPHSDNPSGPQEEQESLHPQEHNKIPTREDKMEENLFYIPSFLRGEGGSRMAVLEPWRSVGRPRGSQGEAENINNDDQRDQVDEHDIVQKETEKAKWEPLNVLSKLEGDNDQKTDLMEELGLGDVDDLEDASDWDSASTASKRTLPGRRLAASPELEAFQQSSSVKAQDEDVNIAAPLTPQRSINSDKRPPSTPSQVMPQPQPRARMMVLQEPESEEDWEPDDLPSCNTVKLDNEPEDIGSPKLSSNARDLETDEQQQKVDKDTTKTATELQRSSASVDTGGSAFEIGMEKPETNLGCLSSQAGLIHQEKQPAAIKSTSEAPMPLQQNYSSNKQQETAVARTLQLELVRGAQHGGAPQTNTLINGDPLSVFDDSTLSELSDDEGRLTTSGRLKNKNLDEVEMAEDFDEVTQSSDTATDDMDSPTSGYRHASLLIQKLDSATLDSRSLVKLQNIFHEYERSIQKARSRHGYLSDKVNQLEMERAELRTSLEEVKDVKSDLDRHQLELQTEVTNLKFQLKQEQENRRNATMMYNTTRDKLRRTEDQHQLEVQERQKVELTLRNLELEMRTLVSKMKRLEEDHSETQRLLVQERSARSLQENLLNSHLRKQQEIEEENKRNMSKSNEALSQLTEASDRERELVQQTVTLQEQLHSLRAELEHSQANSSLKEGHILEENEALKEQLEDARRDLKLNSEALAQTVYNCNNQVTTLKSELAVITTRLENERQTRETMEAELESTRVRLAGAINEAEQCLGARSDTEKALLREKEEHQRLKDRLTGEAASQRETISSMSQKLTKEEARANSMENEVHRVTLQLTEKGLLLEVLQREKDQAAAHIKELESSLRAEREVASHARSCREVTQERLVQAQSESMLLRQQLEEAQNKGAVKDRAVTDAQERFSDQLSKLRSDCEERVQLIEERNKELASKAADFRGQILKLEEEKSERETSLRQLQQELADSLKKLSMSEASLEVNTRYRNDLEEEKARLLKDMDRLKRKLEESEDQYVQTERRINSLKSSLDERERELATAAQKLQEALSASAATDNIVKQLEEAVQRLEIENARLEAAAKQQSNKIDALQKGAQEAAMVKGHLEDLVTNLQSSKMTLEDQLNREVQKQSMLSHTAHDSQALWEEELRSRSKLGLRLAELEKEKGELNTQMEIEKKKSKKIAEQKKAVDSRLDQEMKRNTELQKEMYRLRTLLKTAKKKLRDQDTGAAEFASPMSSVRMDLSRHSQPEGAIGRMKEKVEDLQVQLEKEASRRSQLEQMNGELKDQLSSLRSLSRSNDLLERSKRQLEEEVLELRRRMETAQMEQSQVEQYRRDAEERARQELQQKLEQVNLFLQSQAASQEALDQIKATNEASLRSQMEQKIRELESELGRARTTQQDSFNQRDSTRTELERYRQLYTDELRLRKSLAAKLERANNRLADANSKLLSERSKSLMTSSIANGSLGGPPLDLGTLGSPANYVATLGPLSRSLGLGLSLLSPVTEAQNSRVEDYLAKMQSELDRNISKELNNATAELDVAADRLSPVGSASRVELDPVSRATQQYLEVLKKNNMI